MLLENKAFPGETPLQHKTRIFRPKLELKMNEGVLNKVTTVEGEGSHSFLQAGQLMRLVLGQPRG